jgi:hypothetical protein
VGEDEAAMDFELIDDTEHTGIKRAAIVPAYIVPASPLHPLSSIVTIVLDLLWKGMQAGATLSVIGTVGVIPLILISGVACFVSVTLIQRHVDHDSWGAAIAKAAAMGIVAGVPYFVTGTVVGGVLLGWAGVHNFESLVRGQLPPQSK